jgi:transposase
MTHFASIDLHGNNAVLVIIDEEKKWVFKRKFKNDLELILSALGKYRAPLAGIVVESTYNWYWLVDGLMENGYKVHLAHTAETSTKKTKKYSDDYRDAFHLADLLRKGELAQGYIYPKAERSLRDLLRKRGMLVKSRTKHLNSCGNLVNRHLGIQLKGNELKALSDNDIDQLFNDEYVGLSAQSNLAIIKTLNLQISKLEKAIKQKGGLKREFKVLSTVPGIGDIIALSISLEIGEIKRFGKPGEYVSYSRCVPSEFTSNEKSKGQGNRKNGNKYLKWAYIEAANFTIRFCPHARAFYEKKMKKLASHKAKRTITLNAIGAKLARANYYMLRDGVKYDPEKLFGSAKKQTQTRKKTDKGRGGKPEKGLADSTKKPIV